jgi:hypothetical protein
MTATVKRRAAVASGSLCKVAEKRPFKAGQFVRYTDLLTEIAGQPSRQRAIGD